MTEKRKFTKEEKLRLLTKTHKYEKSNIIIIHHHDNIMW